jgi:hypothetical protein
LSLKLRARQLALSGLDNKRRRLLPEYRLHLAMFLQRFAPPHLSEGALHPETQNNKLERVLTSIQLAVVDADCKRHPC